ncbi:cache domain-containing sensor histidine kinase [Clostridium omnivorum]|uniref:histidine kinase n=1 Tax=Clostridium omnivorum TaxID=1604902 RepID=A0ABQ5N796_9CLOT|nr:sensor histidine kinase [Clostridium sp. E14]GLC31109.1 histidine kinase [Clostridium sp. E14]
MKEILKKYIAAPVNRLLKSFRLRSIQFIITVSFTVITVFAILIVGTTLYNRFNKAAEEDASLSTRQIIEQVNLNLDDYLTSMVQTSNLLNSTINKYPSLPNDKLEGQMNVIPDTKQDIVTLAVFSEDGELLMGSPNSKLKSNVVIERQEWFHSALSLPGSLFFIPPHVQNLFEDKHDWVVSLSRCITFYRNGKGVRGVLLVDLNFKAIEQLCRRVSLGRRGYIYIVDSEGNIVYHPQQQLIYMGLKYENNDDILKHSYGTFMQEFGGDRRLVTVKTVNYTGWKIVGISYMDELVAAKRDIYNYVWFIVITGIIFIIAIFSVISAKISQPIKELEKSMKLVEEGNFDINIDVRGEDEVVELSRTFNIMVSRIRELMDQILVEQEAKRKSDLNALQAQINPHFLYNTLDSIVWMAENGKSQDVITMVTALARLFRISISKGKDIISVEQELEHARNYMIIQKIRYKNKFSFEINADKEALTRKTLKLILQPIIENSIYHGIEYMVDEGLIKINVRTTEDKLIYEISDNGLGMKQEVLENILSFKSKNTGGSGVGVKNVHERIQLSYGKEYGLAIESELEEGTTVTITIPLID